MCAYCEQGPRLHSSIMEEEKKKEGTEGIRGKREKGREDGRKGNVKRETKGQREGNSSEKRSHLRSQSCGRVSTEMVIPQPALW